MLIVAEASSGLLVGAWYSSGSSLERLFTIFCDFAFFEPNDGCPVRRPLLYNAKEREIGCGSQAQDSLALRDRENEKDESLVAPCRHFESAGGDVGTCGCCGSGVFERSPTFAAGERGEHAHADVDGNGDGVELR